MSVSKQEILHIANLASLNLQENEIDQLKAENWELKQIIKEEKEKAKRLQFFVLGFSTATLIAKLIQLFR